MLRNLADIGLIGNREADDADSEQHIMRRGRRGLTRRGFLGLGQGCLAACGLHCARRLLAMGQPALSAIPANRAGGDRASAVVVGVRSDFVVDTGQVRAGVLAAMFGNAMTVLAGATNLEAAWRRFLKPEDIVGIKFNSLGERQLCGAAPLAAVLVGSLIEAGWPAERIVLANAPQEIPQQFKTRPLQFGWTRGPVDFGSACDYLSSFVEQVTAIINVPLLKDDNITGLSGCLKNVTYGLMKHPARFHADGGTPYLTDLYALPMVSQKLRLNVMNALQSVYDGGPLVDPDRVATTGLLLLGQDGVAVDCVALDALNAIRRNKQLPPRQAPALQAAGERGLGVFDLRKIKRLTATAG